MSQDTENLWPSLPWIDDPAEPAEEPSVGNGGRGDKKAAAAKGEAHLARCAAHAETVAVLRAALDATAVPPTAAQEAERRACLARLAPGGSARCKAAAIKAWAVQRVPPRDDE